MGNWARGEAVERVEMTLCRRLLVLWAVGRGLEQVPCSVVGVWRFHVDMHEERACSPSDMRAYADAVDSSLRAPGDLLLACPYKEQRNKLSNGRRRTSDGLSTWFLT